MVAAANSESKRELRPHQTCMKYKHARHEETRDARAPAWDECMGQEALSAIYEVDLGARRSTVPTPLGPCNGPARAEAVCLLPLQHWEEAAGSYRDAPCAPSSTASVGTDPPPRAQKRFDPFFSIGCSIDPPHRAKPAGREKSRARRGAVLAIPEIDSSHDA